MNLLFSLLPPDMSVTAQFRSSPRDALQRCMAVSGWIVSIIAPTLSIAETKSSPRTHFAVHSRAQGSYRYAHLKNRVKVMTKFELQSTRMRRSKWGGVGGLVFSLSFGFTNVLQFWTKNPPWFMIFKRSKPRMKPLPNTFVPNSEIPNYTKMYILYP